MGQIRKSLPNKKTPTSDSFMDFVESELHNSFLVNLIIQASEDPVNRYQILTSPIRVRTNVSYTFARNIHLSVYLPRCTNVRVYRTRT